jgi:hypothetical protein
MDDVGEWLRGEGNPLMNHQTKIKEALALIFRGIAQLKSEFHGKQFTIDGRLVGDIGEVIAELEYDLQLFRIQAPLHDGKTSDGRLVQIKAPFKDRLSITEVPDLYLGLQLFEDGTHREVFNGPGQLIKEEYGHRGGFGEKQLSFPLVALEKLSREVPTSQRVPRRVL